MQFYFRVISCLSKIAGAEDAKDPVLAGFASLSPGDLAKLKLSRYPQSKLSAGRLCAILSRVCKPRLLPSFRPKQQGSCFHPTSRDMPPLSMDRARILGLRLPKNGVALLERFLAAESSPLAVSGSSLFT